MPLTLYRRGQIWHYRGTVAGRRLRGSCGTEIEDIARQVALEVERRQWQGHLNGPEAVLTFAQAAILYRQAQKPDRFLRPVEDHFRDRLVRDITAGAIRQAAVTLYPAAGAATRNRQAIVPAQAIINHAAELGLARRLSVRRFPVEKREKRPATWDWVEAFMAHANPHLAALCCFMFLTGARISEALALIWADVDLAAARALIRQTKVGSERRAHLPPALTAAMANISGPREGKVFRYSSRATARPQWMKAIARAGIAPLSFHACRHGFATALLQAGIDPITVARLGGWSDARHLFSTYGHARDDDTLADRIARPAGTRLTQRAAPTKITKA